MNLIKLIKYGKYKNYLEAATGGVLKNLVIFTGKHLCWSHFLIKLQSCNYGKETPTQVFSLHIRKFLKTPILKNISKRLLLIILLVQQFNCFPMSFYNYKEKLIFRWIKCSVKLDYAIEWGIFLKTLSKSLKGKIHCEIFLSEHSWNIVSGWFHEKQNTFMKYFYFSTQHSLRTFFINKKIVLTKKRYRVKFNSIKKYFVTHKAKTKKFKNTKTYLNETMFENQERQKCMW